MMFKKKRLAIATAVYWVLLAYIIALLAFWFIELQTASRQMTNYRLQELKMDDPLYAARLSVIRAEEQRKTAQYIGEGTTFLGLILLGALFVYRQVRRQIRQQMQQQNFMLAVTHELKTPIAITKLNLETLQKHKLDEGRQQKIIQASLQETSRLDTLANNILIASQLEGGGYVQVKEELDLSALVQRSVEDLRRRLPDRKWTCHIEEGLSLRGDTLLLQMLTGNLVENALKYSPREGMITITLKKEKRHILLSVKDEGPGIPDDEKKKVFAKFYRTGQEGTRATKGTGLGLYLCRKIADDHHATIKVTDNSPVGSIFTVTF
ncbi:MAG TPA: ATP-binding protein [Puia sp.]|jgi:signal transduction histidine kinase